LSAISDISAVRGGFAAILIALATVFSGCIVGPNFKKADTTVPSAWAPGVSSISPTSGPKASGTTVTITGTDLLGATAVIFGTKVGKIVSKSATQIVVKTPAGVPGTVDVKVVTVGGASAISPADQFTYIAAPTIAGVNANRGPLAGGTIVTITGTNPLDATGVNFGLAPGSIVSETATQIVVTSPSGAAGTVNVKVVTASGTSSTSSADKFTYVAAPIVGSLSANSGPVTGGTQVTIRRTNLANAAAVNFGSETAIIVSETATKIVVKSPTGVAGTLDVTIVTAGGTSLPSTTDQFTYL
jgi:hypothetical protein